MATPTRRDARGLIPKRMWEQLFAHALFYTWFTSCITWPRGPVAHRKAIVEAVRETWQQVVEERRARDSLTWPSKTWVRWWVRGRRERASFAAAEDEGACFRPAAGGEFHHLFPWAFGWGSGVCSCLRTGRKAKATLRKIYNCRYVHFE